MTREMTDEENKAIAIKLFETLQHELASNPEINSSGNFILIAERFMAVSIVTYTDATASKTRIVSGLKNDLKQLEKHILDLIEDKRRMLETGVVRK